MRITNHSQSLHWKRFSNFLFKIRKAIKKLLISKFLFSKNTYGNNVKRIVKTLLKFDRGKRTKVFGFLDSSPIGIGKLGYIKVIVTFFLSIAVKGQNKVLNNGKIRIGRGSENSINTIGNMQQPFYYNEKTSSWRQLTYGKHPLDIVWGVGNDGTNNWNYNGRLIQNPGLLNYNINYDNFVITNSTTGQGYGKIVFSGYLVVDNQNFFIENTYTLEENTAYIKAKIKVINKSGRKATNIRLWIGTKDDFVGKSDSPNKERGNIVNGAFVVNTSALDQAKAIKISTDDEAVLFYSNSDRAHTSIGNCCYFLNAVKQDPKTSNVVTNRRDSSYALYVRFNDLENNQSDELEFYYAAGTLAKINDIISEVSNAAALVKNILCESASYDYSFEKTGITSYLVIPSAAVAPTELQIEEGIDYNNEFKIISKGKIATTANEKYTFNFRSLNENTPYTVYAVTKFNDGSSDIFSPISNVNFTTKEKPTKPTGNDKQEFLVSHLTDAKVSSLYTVQRGTEWYASADDASSRLNELEDKTILINGKKYYGIQYDGVCSSEIFEVTVKVSTFTQIILEQIGNEADIPNLIKSNITVNQIASIDPFISNVKFSNENLYQEFIDSNPNLFSNPATVSEVQDMVNVVNQSQNILNQIGSEADKPNIVNSVVTVAQINTIRPMVIGANPSYETSYQEFIDSNPDLFSNPATVVEVQKMIDLVNTSQSVLEQIGKEGDDADIVNSVVTVAEINTIMPMVIGVNPSYEGLYQDYIDANPDLFSNPATVVEVQTMIDSVNTSQSVLEQIGSEADKPNIVNSVVTVAQINTIRPIIIGANPAYETLYQNYIDLNPNLFSDPATAGEIQAMVDVVNISQSVLEEIGNEGDNPDSVNSVVTVAKINTINPAVIGANPFYETLYQDYIDVNPNLFSSPATVAEVQSMIDVVNTSQNVLEQIGNEGDNPDSVNSVVTVAQINMISPVVTGANPFYETLYQDYIDANPDLFSSSALVSEVQGMIDSVNISQSVLEQIGNEGDDPDSVNSVVTVAQIKTISPIVTGTNSSHETLYQEFIDSNPDLFSSPATVSEVQGMIDSVNTSQSVLEQIGNEGDNPNSVNSVVTVIQINTISPIVTGAKTVYKTLYQDYIDSNPDLFSSPATVVEVQTMIDVVNTSQSVLEEIGNEGDNPDSVNSVVTVAQINTISPVVIGANSAYETLYQDYVDSNPDLFSSPATVAEVQSMIDVVNTSQSVLEQIGNEGDSPNSVNSVVTVVQINTISPVVIGANPAYETLYQNYIDANSDLFSSPATVAEVQLMIDVVNTSQSVLEQVGSEGDNPDSVNSVVTVAQINTISPAVTGANPTYETLYQDYVDSNPDLFSSPATVSEVQSMIDVVNTSQSVLEQIGKEGDNPNSVNSVVTVAQINMINPSIIGASLENLQFYQDYIDANPELFGEPATAFEVQSMIYIVNVSQSALVQIGKEGDSPDIVNCVISVDQINKINPPVIGANSEYSKFYQDYIDLNPDLFSSPATVLEVQSMINIVNSSQSVLKQIGNEGDNPNRINSAVTVSQINKIYPAITEVETAYEINYQAYIDTNPNLFSTPATIFEVQSMINVVNTSQSVLAQIGREGDTPDRINSVITVDQINRISPTIVGTDPSKEIFYQDHIDANPNLFSNPATAEEVQTMINILIIDNDKDGVPDFYDLDDDNDGILDSNEDNEDSNRDTDRDGILDRFDLDSDGDGILDLVESGQNSASVDSNRDGILDSTVDKDFDGLLDVVDEDYTNSFTGAKGIVIPDGSDNDNIPDFQDLDSDNDGISDLIEGGIDLNLDEDNNGMIDDRIDSNNNGVIDFVDSVLGGIVVSLPDTDNDDIPDFQDLDSDNDGAYDVEEVGGIDSDNDGRIDIKELKNLLDSDNDNIPNFQDIDDDEDGILTLDEDINGDNILNNDDTDKDGIPNYLDPDDDGDGVLTNNENIGDCDFDGLPDYLDITDCNIAPEGFSPNNDKVNDEFVIPFLLKYPDFSIEIYSRSGRKTYVYENNGREKPIWWNGYANASLIFYGSNPVPVGPYYYLIKLNDGSKKEYEGWVYINR
ncbi:gliding motility-associated C-terminal domain-containing protein [Tenacibaculum sp. C7A-26P2]|uniref:gliding motility-associated C-terminal domain-containing protein n=1 Tax=Tenacibaculum sp. C7A-26P2 TaxID=3447504 RepID=UPI003F82C130